MKLFLSSTSSKYHLFGIRRFNKQNSYYANIKNSIKKYDNFVFVSNDPANFERNDRKAKPIFRMFKKQIHDFKNYVVLDNRNKKQSKKILSNADFIYITGGKIPAQNKFLKDINFVQTLKENKDVVVAGISAGAMNSCSIIYCYPEEDSEVGDKMWYTGLGYCNQIIVPHFHKKKGNTCFFGSFDIMKDYLLPDSKGKTFLALTNTAYVKIDESGTTLYGEAYSIRDGELKQICTDGECIRL